MDPEHPIYLSEGEIVELHDRVIGRFGGMPGLRDCAALESCAALPKTLVFEHERYGTIYEKAAAYCYFIVRNHPFFDGNKRTGFLAALHFMLQNGVTPAFDEDEMYVAIDGVAKGESGLDALAAAFRKGHRG